MNSLDLSEELIQSLKSHFVNEMNEETFIFPLFKFMKSAHADSMMNKNTLRISNISSYRNPSLGGLISDPDEGKVTLLGNIDNDMHFVSFAHESRIQVDNAYLFCATQNLLSDSLKWALGEQKDICLLIVDPIDFVKAINASSDRIDFCGGSPCLYKGRSFNFNDELGQQLVQNHFGATLLKDEKFSVQKEFRLTWQIKKSGTIAPEFLDINLTHSQHIIPIDYKDMASYFDDQGPGFGMIGVNIYNEVGNEIAGFELEHPSTVFRPVIHGSQERRLSFYPENYDNSWRKGYFRCGFATSNVQPLLGDIPIKDIKRIAYRYYPGERWIEGRSRV